MPLPSISSRSKSAPVKKTPTKTSLTSTSEQESSSAGALWALSGYFRQILGSVAKSITVHKEMDRSADGQKCEVHFALEEYDDALAEHRHRSGDSNDVTRIERCLIQFKYSRDPSRHDFSPVHLHDIATAFVKSRTQAEQTNGTAKVTTRLIVASNRTRSDVCREMIEAVKKGVHHPKFDEKTTGKNPKPKWTKESIALIGEIEWEFIAARDLRGPVEARALELGVRRCELDEAIIRVVGYFFKAVSASGPTTASEQLIDRLLANISDARPLLSSAAHEAMKRGLRQFGMEAWMPGEGVLHSRRVESDLRNLLTRRGLVFLYGEGGNGKSSLLYTALSSGSSESIIAPETRLQPPFRAGCMALRWRNNVLAECLASWRGDAEGKYSHEPLETALERLAAAHGERELPLLFIGLDALDETALDTNASAVEEMLARALEEDRRREQGEAARFVLIVTSRQHPREFHGLFSPFDSEAEKNAHYERALRVDAFDPEELESILESHQERTRLPELREAWEQIIPIVRQQRQELTSSPRDAQFTFATEVGSSSAASAREARDFSVFAGTSIGISGPSLTVSDLPSDADASMDTFDADDEEWLREVVDSLRHPALWSCFRSLDESHQLSVLRREPEALRRLVDAMLEWFKKKFRKRKPGPSDQFSDDVRDVLRIAARALHEEGLRFGQKQKHWIAPARDADIQSGAATRIYDEALSSGLILRRATNSWYWRHRFFGNVLIDER